MARSQLDIIPQVLDPTDRTGRDLGLHHIIHHDQDDAGGHNSNFARFPTACKPIRPHEHDFLRLARTHANRDCQRQQNPIGCESSQKLTQLIPTVKRPKYVTILSYTY